MKRLAYVLLPGVLGLAGFGKQTASVPQDAPPASTAVRGEILWQYETGG